MKKNHIQSFFYLPIIFLAIFVFSIRMDTAIASCDDPGSPDPAIYNTWAWNLSICTSPAHYSESTLCHNPLLKIVLPTTVTSSVTGLPVYYRFQVSEDSDFTDIISDTGWISSPNKSFSADMFKPSSKYYWRFAYSFKPVSGNPVCSAWTVYDTFDTLPVGTAPACVGADSICEGTVFASNDPLACGACIGTMLPTYDRQCVFSPSIESCDLSNCEKTIVTQNAKCMNVPNNGCGSSKSASGCANCASITTVCPTCPWKEVAP